MPPSVRSFAEDIRGRSDEQLATLVLRRPDLARPVPADLTALAGRAATRASIARALDGLDTLGLLVLEAHLVGASLDRAPRSLLEGMTKREFDAVTADLWTVGLLWGAPSERRPVRGVTEALAHPANLGPGAAEVGLELPQDLAAAIAALPERAAMVLERTKWTHWRLGSAGPSVSAALDDLVRAGLGVRDGRTVVIPREVGVAARGDRLALHLARPATAAQHLAPGVVEAAGASAAADLVWAVGETLRRLADSPPRVMRAGGLSVRDHKLVTGWLDTTPERSAFVLEIAAAAGLLASDNEADPSWLPTPEYDEWLALDIAERWATLAAAWWRTTRAPSLAGSRAADGSVVNVLGPDAQWPLMRARRQDVVAVLADLDAGAAIGPDIVDAQLRWLHPIRLAGDVPTHSQEILREADWLGVTGRGALTNAGRALEAQEPPLADLIRPHLPQPVDKVLLQADLTAVAPGPLIPDLDRLMNLVADVESRGGATVFRLSEASLRRGLDTGLSADDLRDRLKAASLTPVPQPLDYLITDAARRHGQTRIGSVSSYLRSDDPTTLETLIGEPALRVLQLRRIAPTVLVSPSPAATVLDLVREAGHGAVVETSDGGVVIDRATSARAPRPSAPAVHVQRLDAQAANDLVAQLRSRDDSAQAAADSPRIPATDPSVTVTTLLDAAAEGVPVWIGYVDGALGLRRLLVHPRDVAGGRLVARVGTDSRDQNFAIHRITGVAPA